MSQRHSDRSVQVLGQAVLLLAVLAPGCDKPVSLPLADADIVLPAATDLKGVGAPCNLFDLSRTPGTNFFVEQPKSGGWSTPEDVLWARESAAMRFPKKQQTVVRVGAGYTVVLKPEAVAWPGRGTIEVKVMHQHDLTGLALGEIGLWNGSQLTRALVGVAGKAGPATVTTTIAASEAQGQQLAIRASVASYEAMSSTLISNLTNWTITQLCLTSMP